MGLRRQVQDAIFFFLLHGRERGRTSLSLYVPTTQPHTTHMCMHMCMCMCMCMCACTTVKVHTTHRVTEITPTSDHYAPTHHTPRSPPVLAASRVWSLQLEYSYSVCLALSPMGHGCARWPGVGVGAALLSLARGCRVSLSHCPQSPRRSRGGSAGGRYAALD